MSKDRMADKALVFVTGHRRPAVAPLAARYVRRHPDGEPVRAVSTKDTLEAALARHAPGPPGRAPAASEAPAELAAGPASSNSDAAEAPAEAAAGPASHNPPAPESAEQSRAPGPAKDRRLK